jgi:hypothetical protein
MKNRTLRAFLLSVSLLIIGGADAGIVFFAIKGFVVEVGFMTRAFIGLEILLAIALTIGGFCVYAVLKRLLFDDF